MKRPRYLRVHVVDEQLWYQDTEPAPACYGDPAEFASDPMLDDYTSIRLVGMHCNAHLITKLYEAKVKTEVCTPLIVEKRADRHKPSPILFELGLCSLASSQGGFHEVIDSDYHAYMLAWHMAKPCRAVDVVPLLGNHPGWKSLDFCNTWFVEGAKVLAYLIDPRWYVDLAYPDRRSKLFEALGLNPQTQAVVTRGKNAKRLSRVDICRSVRDCWKQPNSEEDIKKIIELAGNKPRTNTDKFGLRPEDFVWRCWARYSDPVIADLRASQYFAAFLQQTWLNEIYRDAASVPEERAALFRPADFFRHDEEAHAYERYSARIPPQISS